MNFFRKCTLYSCIVVFVAMLFAGCGKKGPGAEERIKALEEQGVPDSVLSSVKVYLYNTICLFLGEFGRPVDRVKDGSSISRFLKEKSVCV